MIGKLSIGVAVVMLMAISPAGAQQPAKIPRVGVLSASGNPSAPGAQVEGLRRGLSELGYIEGKNIHIEYRYLEGVSGATARLVEELIQLKPDVLVLGNQPAINAAKQATKTIPIVMVTAEDPVAAGFVASLARPGGNITGVTRLTRELSGKRLELLKEAVPGLARVGALASEVQTTNDFNWYKAPAQALNLHLQLFTIKATNPDLDAVFQAMVNARAAGLVTVSGSLINRHLNRIMALATKHRLASMHERADYVEAGGLLSYAADDDSQYRRVAYYIDRILKGTKPADLPVEQPTKFEFVINLKTAKAINLTIPPEVLARATRIIR